MTNDQLSTPVALFVFNRPTATARVLEAIEVVRPRRLFIVADGPRDNHPTDAAQCVATRSILDCVDWPCEIHTNYADVNLGCRRRVSSGLDWLFANVSEAIILEDDCLPHSSFFPYCEELLERYRDDDRIGMISGDNFQPRARTYRDSYYYSRYIHIWGWASWRRAWIHYDVDMKLWPSVRATSILEHFLGSRHAARAWRDIFDEVYAGRINTWDYQWTFACWMRNALSILPRANLVSNIGFGDGATHTADAGHQSGTTGVIDSPLQHPSYMLRNIEADAYTQLITLGMPGLINRARRRLTTFRPR